MRYNSHRMKLRFRVDRPAVRWREVTRLDGADRLLSDRIERVTRYVSVRVGRVSGIDELAEVAGLSRYHFARVFREEVGQSPWSYVKATRARRALELLEDGLSPAEAALEAGFADQSHLTRTLRQVEGRTPGQVRRERACAGRVLAQRKIVQETEGDGSDHVDEPDMTRHGARTREERIPADPILP